MIVKTNLRLHLLILIIYSISSSIEGLETEQVTIKLIPNRRPTVGSQIKLLCTGPLANGGALVHYEGSKENLKTVVQFELQNVTKKTKSGNKLKTDVVLQPANDFKSLGFRENFNKSGDTVKFSFKADISLNGYLMCQFFGDDKKTAEVDTPSLSFESYVPSKISLFEFKTYFENEKLFTNITCGASLGYPIGGLSLMINGSTYLKTSETKIPLYIAGGFKSMAIEKLAKLEVSMALVNKSVTCVAGGKNGSLEGNPKPDNETITLKLEVPLSATKIIPLGRKIFKAGENLTCVSEGVPRPTISWTMEVNGKTLEIEGPHLAVPQTEGIYIAECIANNTVYNKTFSQKTTIEFGVMPTSQMINTEPVNNIPLIIASCCAAIFGLIALITTIMYCRIRKRSSYESV